MLGAIFKIYYICGPPEGFQAIDHIDTIHGTGDPQVHMTRFKLMMLVNGASGLFLCKTVLTLLEKTALLWFSSLPVRSIHEFTELSQAFVNCFSSSQVYKKIVDSLNTIRQGQQEPLREYLDRFNAIAMQI